jgi:hypothetical protein
MNFNKTFYWTVQLKQEANSFEQDKIITILDNIAKYIPEFNDYGRYEDKKIIKYLLRTNRNTGRIEISSNAIDFYFDMTESNNEWFDYPNIIFDIIFNSELVLPLSIDHIKRSSITTFSTKINHGQIMYDLFLKDGHFAKSIGQNKIMNFIPNYYILLDKNNAIYNQISFRSDSSYIEDMEKSYLKPEELIIWFEVRKSRGFNPIFNFSECFRSFENYFNSFEYKNYMNFIENPIYEYIKKNDS